MHAVATGVGWLGEGARRGAKAVGVGILLVVGLSVSLGPASLLAQWEPTGIWYVPYFAVMGALIATGIGALLSRRITAWMVDPVNAGSRYPYWFLLWVALNIITLAMAMFATLVWLLHTHDHGILTAAPGRELSRASVLDFFLWHSLEFVPLLDINDTLRWQVPVTYSGGWVGATLLAYKAGIVVPIILGFRSARREHHLRSERRQPDGMRTPAA